MAASLPTLDEIRSAVREELERWSKENQPPTLWSVEQAAEHTGLSACTIRRQVKAGKLKSVRHGARVLIDAASFKPHEDGAEVVSLAHAARHGRR